MNAVAIITARGGSKRIPRKNIRKFFDKPIIAYSIEKAILSKIFCRVIVSTDDEEIAKITWDGKYVVAASKQLSYDKIVVFEASTGDPLWFYTSEYSGDFDALTIARDGKTFAVAHTSGRIYLFNITGTKPFLILDEDDFEELETLRQKELKSCE